MSKKAFYYWNYNDDTTIKVMVLNKFARRSPVTYSFEHNGDTYKNENCFIMAGSIDQMRDQIDEIICKACDEVDDLDRADARITEEMSAIFTD